jgi:hypothetical protein
VRRQHQVAQFDQVVADAVVGVILVNFPLQQANAVECALQALVGAHDADVIPHEPSQFGPVVGDDDLLVRIAHAAFVPLRQMGQGGGRNAEDVSRCRRRKHHAFQQRVRGQAIGAMQAGEGGFADGVEAGEVGTRGQVGDHAAAGIVCRRHHGYRLARDVDAEFAAAREDGREVLGEEFRRLVRHVEEDAVEAVALHFEVDGAGDDVSRREFGTFVVSRHEARAVGQAQQAALAAQGFGDQE